MSLFTQEDRQILQSATVEMAELAHREHLAKGVRGDGFFKRLSAAMCDMHSEVGFDQADRDRALAVLAATRAYVEALEAIFP